MRSFPGTGVRVLLAVMVSFVAASWGLPAPAAAAPDAIERLDRWLSANESFRAGFAQSVFDEDRILIAESRGTVAFLRPYRFRWDYDAPAPQVIVANGNEVWWYDIDLQQATVRPVDAALEGTPAVLLSGPRRAGEHFRTSVLDSADGTDWVRLVPRSSDAVFRAIRVGLRGNEIRVVEMDDGFGQTTRIEFFDVEHNPPLEAALFQFEPPPEADVVRGE